MRRYRLFEKELLGHPVMMVLSCIMDESEDLTIDHEEAAARDLLKWLNERGCVYHIEVNRYDPERKKRDPDDMFGYASSLHDYHYAQMMRRDHYDVLIYDDATATLMSMFFERFTEIIPPEVLAARAAEKAAAEAREKAIADQRAAEDAANAKRIAKGKSPMASKFEPVAPPPEDNAAPPTRAWLMNIGDAFNAVIFGKGYTKTEAQKRREKA